MTPFNSWMHIGASMAALALYEAWLTRRARRAPMHTASSAHAALRASWVRSIMSRPGTEILAIQTLRNSVMAASLMATTSILALSATLSLGEPAWKSATTDPVGGALVLLLAASFVVSFLLLAMAVRFFNHTGYLVADPGRTELAIAYLNRASQLYSFGLRAFFACTPFLAGLFNTLLILPATAVLLALLFVLDRVPTAQDNTGPST